MMQKEAKMLRLKITLYLSKNIGVQIDNAEDLDVMSMYNLLEYNKITEKQREVYGIITETKQVILFLLILNLLNTRQVLQ